MNILLITTDQQHARMMSCAGEAHAATPALDALAAAGTRFELAYSPNPVCVPCRYSWLSGVMPHVFGGMEGNPPTHPTIREHIDTPLLGHLFRDAGFETVCGGKMHVEEPYNFRKEDEGKFGFDHLTENNRDELAARCAAFLEQDRGRPFFLWASFDNPHDICHFNRDHVREAFIRATPVESLPPLPANFEPTRDETSWMRHFRDGSLEAADGYDFGLNRTYGKITGDWDETMWRYYRAYYRHCLETIDAQIGSVLAALRRSSHAANTLVCLTSDHGDHDGAHRLAMKRSFYEESARVPFILSGPGIRAGEVDRRHPVNTGLDLIPTLCDYAGLAVPAGLKGKSLRRLAEGDEVADWPVFTISQTLGGRMVRTLNFKYNLYNTAEEELFDMLADPGEMINLANDPRFVETIREHRKILAQWAKAHDDDKAKGYLERMTCRSETETNNKQQGKAR